MGAIPKQNDPSATSRHYLQATIGAQRKFFFDGLVIEIQIANLDLSSEAKLEYDIMVSITSNVWDLQSSGDCNMYVKA